MRSFRHLNHLLKAQSRPMAVVNTTRTAWMKQNACAMSVVPFKLADIGEGIAEVELMKWFVKVSNPEFLTFFQDFLSETK